MTAAVHAVVACAGEVFEGDGGAEEDDEAIGEDQDEEGMPVNTLIFLRWSMHSLIIHICNYVLYPSLWQPLEHDSWLQVVQA